MPKKLLISLKKNSKKEVNRPVPFLRDLVLKKTAGPFCGPVVFNLVVGSLKIPERMYTSQAGYNQVLLSPTRCTWDLVLDA
jgi:hypothetical protein